MKKLSLVAALTLSTALSACGGGGGHGHIPTTTLPDIPDTPSVACEGVTCMTNDGSLSNSAKRTELYYKAQGASTYSLRRMNRNNSDLIKSAYDDMQDFLINNAINTSNAEDLRKNLILAGFENLPENDDELKTWASDRQNMIKKHAQKAYDMYATEKSVYLDNAKLSLVEETGNQDTYINFIIDNSRSGEIPVIKGIEIAENAFGAEALTNKLDITNGNNFTGIKDNNTIHRYIFPVPNGGGRKLMIEVSEDKPGVEPSLAAIKEKLQLKLQERAAESLASGNDFLENNKAEISQAIKDLVGTDNLNHNVIERTFNATYASAAKNLGGVDGNNLLYSDFGTLTLTGTRTNITDPETENINKTQVFAGGYDALKIAPEKITENLRFEGDAVGGVNYKKIVDGDETIRDSDTMELKGGKATLDFANGQEKLNATFNNWYNVDVTKDLNTGKGEIAFSNGEKIADEKFKFNAKNTYENNDFIGEKWNRDNQGHAGAMDIGYYGKDGNPSEATGYVMYHEEIKTAEIDTATGNNLFDVLEVQIGVGMQKK